MSKLIVVPASTITNANVNSGRMATNVGSKALKPLIEKILYVNRTAVEPLICYPVTDETADRSYQDISDFRQCFDDQDVNFSILEGDDIAAKYTLPASIVIKDKYEIIPKLVSCDGHRRTTSLHITSILKGTDEQVTCIVFDTREEAEEMADSINENKTLSLKLTYMDKFEKCCALISEGVITESVVIRRLGLKRNDASKIFGYAIASANFPTVAKFVRSKLFDFTKVKHTDGQKVKKMASGKEVVEYSKAIILERTEGAKGSRAVSGKDLTGMTLIITNPDLKAFLMDLIAGEKESATVGLMKLNALLNKEA